MQTYIVGSILQPKPDLMARGIRVTHWDGQVAEEGGSGPALAFGLNKLCRASCAADTKYRSFGIGSSMSN